MSDKWFQVGDIVELAEDLEFLSCATGMVTVGNEGDKCHVVGLAKRPDNGVELVTLMLVGLLSCGFSTSNADISIRQVKTCRDKATDAAVEFIPELDGVRTIAGRLYDAGLLRLPEDKS